ncbi:MAG: 50S ribosomal protein L4 [Planctomycetes bacterium]|nr:50S ribosomal protein L4 [Planctomycetota bacterium]
MVDVKTYNKTSDQLDKIEVDATFFGDKVKKRLLKEAVLMYEANKRQGTHSTLTRAEVSLTGKKPYRQKGTGYARAGDYKSPIWRGGGVAFGPKPRDYSYSMPRKAKKEALRSALYAKLQDNEVFFVMELNLESPKTKEAAATLAKLELEGKTLILLSTENSNLYKSFKNIAKVTVVPVDDVNAYHLIYNKNIVFIGDAFDQIKNRLAH